MRLCIWVTKFVGKLKPPFVISPRGFFDAAGALLGDGGSCVCAAEVGIALNGEGSWSGWSRRWATFRVCLRRSYTSLTTFLPSI